MMPRVLVVDDDTLYAEAAAAILSLDDRLEVVGRAADGREAVELAHELQPDVVVMDVHMPAVDGLEATRRLTAELPAVRVIVVTSSSDDTDRLRAREAGAHVFLRKQLGDDALLEAALAAARQEVAL
jgi:DNA-binding NarL/FixJ family response regulator